MEDQIKILEEMLELSIKIGRRMMHDYKHMLNEIPKDNMFKEDFTKRAEVWETIFYPDDGMKNYRARLHFELENLERELERAQKLLIENGIHPTPHLPF